MTSAGDLLAAVRGQAVRSDLSNAIMSSGVLPVPAKSRLRSSFSDSKPMLVHTSVVTEVGVARQPGIGFGEALIVGVVVRARSGSTSYAAGETCTLKSHARRPGVADVVRVTDQATVFP